MPRLDKWFVLALLFVAFLFFSKAVEVREKQAKKEISQETLRTINRGLDAANRVIR